MISHHSLGEPAFSFYLISTVFHRSRRRACSVINVPQILCNKDPVETVKISAAPVIYMPKWADYSKAEKDAKDSFDNMYKVLAKHEKNHYYILLEQVAMFQKLLNGLDELSAKDAKTKWKVFQADHKKAQKKYDDATDHGIKEGVML
mgnify:CR=1 FL=1